MARLESNIFPVLNENVLAKLHSRNIYTVYDFILYSTDDLMKHTGLSFKAIENIKESFLKTFGSKIMNSIDIYHQEKEDVIPTGIEKLDDLLEGGLRYKRIYEICGSSSSGKSQLCHWISLHATINALRVYYIDCSRNFSTSRIQMILESKQCSDIIIGKVMSNIIVHQISTINDLFTIFHNLSKMTNTGENELNKKLVIVDSLSVLCTTVANNELNPILSNFASVSRFFINYFNAIIINVNTIKIVHKGDLFCDKDKHLRADMKPSLGNYWLSIPNIRLLIIAIENTQREISIWNSYQLANGKKCLVDIRDDGVFDNFLNK